MVEDGSRDSAGFGDFATARERLPTLRFLTGHLEIEAASLN